LVGPLKLVGIESVDKVFFRDILAHDKKKGAKKMTRVHFVSNGLRALIKTF
jgi:hypothetical protein